MELVLNCLKKKKKKGKKAHPINQWNKLDSPESDPHKNR